MDFLPKILHVDDEQILIDSVARILSKGGYNFESVKTGKAGLEAIEKKYYDLVLLDLGLPDIPGQVILEKILKKSPETMVVIVTGNATLENAVQAIRKGAADFIAKPFSPGELRNLLKRITNQIKLTRENELLRRRIVSLGEEQLIIGESRVMREMIDLVEKVAPTDSTVLITGESGTGKEIIARAVHEKSNRFKKDFVPIDCTSLVETLLESELFGHVKGSFTGAMETKHGYFELASGGTMFFDEVGNLPFSIQAKLLRVLQTRQFSPVGSTSIISSDLRILAATNKSLEELIEEGHFREDLYYRLNVVPLHMPPLRERLEDIPLLVEYFLERYNRRRQISVEKVSPEAMAIMQSYHWPGNVRELENTIERALILEEGDILTLKSLPMQLAVETKTFTQGRPLALAQVEKEHIIYVLKLVNQNRSKAASLLGIDRKTLYNKLDKYGLK